MISAGGQPWRWMGVMLPLILAAFLHQSFATVTTPTPAQTTAAPHKDPGRPDRGKYNVTNSNNTVCLLAYMGLQLNITYNSTSQNKTVQEVVNVKPNVTLASGSCEADRAVLELKTDANKTVLTFVFTQNMTSGTYHLSEASLTTSVLGLKEGNFSAKNSSLDFLPGTLGYSYMCRMEQTLTVTQNLSINTFQVQLQPFGVSGNAFGAAVECQLDEDDMLIPIIVGAALAGLVLVVLLAYLIGRKRSHAGYQTI
ncbi:lysosome-associated membrane glycoprotein 1b [Poecilia reticulata]|uniref:Lysosome-associated membrane glycoprotein 1 n=1 Tax=Poecilia reticulata TaxID=8081 RepID=A0A3P9NXC6_POERE|nr:PREDICTED: lysosome-associated membrane glycoprotein 1-like [Poecilia reticulata]